MVQPSSPRSWCRFATNGLLQQTGGRLLDGRFIHLGVEEEMSASFCLECYINKMKVSLERARKESLWREPPFYYSEEIWNEVAELVAPSALDRLRKDTTIAALSDMLVGELGSLRLSEQEIINYLERNEAGVLLEHLQHFEKLRRLAWLCMAAEGRYSGI